MSLDQEAITDDGASPASSIDDGDLIDTMGEASIPSETDKPAEEPQKTEDASKTDAKPGEDDALKGDDDGKKDEGDRFDKHPRFQELIETKNTLKEQVKSLQAQIDELTATKAEEKETDPGYKDISKLSPEEVREWMDSDPVGYSANLMKQAKAELTKDFDEKLSEKSKEDKVLKTFSDYAEKNKDFDTMWDSGEIQRYMDKHPGHNAISAHMAITMKSKIETAVKEATKEAEEKVIKDFKAKKDAKVLDAGPASARTPADKAAPELKDPKKFGGVTTVLAQRLKNRRASQAAQA